jgi:predicted DNA-binding protein
VAYCVGKKCTNNYLTDPSAERLETLSQQTGLSVAKLIRRAIDDFLKKQP